MATLFCQKCATEITPKTRRCPTCGAKILPQQVTPEVVDDRFADSRRVNNLSTPYVETRPTASPTPTNPSKPTKPFIVLPKEIVDELPEPLKKYVSSEGNMSESTIVYGIMSLLFPFIGIVMYFSWRNTRPADANTVLIGTVLGTIFYVFSLLSSL